MNGSIGTGGSSNDGLSVDALRFRFPAVEGLPAVSVLAGAGFCMPGRTAGVILGPADAGKTTLVRILAGLVPRFTGGELEGSARFGGLDLLAARPYDAMDTVGLVFQDPDEQIITTRCDSEVAFALESLGVARSDMDSRIEGGLRLMGLEALRHRNPGTLSGGEKKRLLIACLVALDPSLWILDEVFQELDHSWRVALLRHVRERERTALFFDSRWTSLYGARCTELAVLAKGRILRVRPGGPGGDDPQTADGLLMEEGLVLPPNPIESRRAAGGEPCLRARGLTFRFPGPGSFELAVEDLTLDRGVVTAVVGRNGSGKSTLGRILCGLLVPEKGSIELRRGMAFQPASPRSLQQRVGYLFQNPDYQVFLPTVAEELAFGLRGTGLGVVELNARVNEAIELFRLPRGSTPASLMSYGARRRLQAATFHLLTRNLLILDEIDSGLGYRDILALLSALGAGGRGIVLVTHDMALARYVAARVLVMEGGSIVEDLAAPGFAPLDLLSRGE